MPGLINADELDTSPPEWLVDGILPRVGFGIVHGPSYSGKSLVAGTELALAIANGTPFLGREAVQGCAVVALGEGLYDAGIRLEARLARQQRDDPGADYTSERLFIQTAPFTVPLTAQGEPTDSLRAAIGQLQMIPGLELLVLDALSDFSGGLSISNDSSANRMVLGMKMLVRELDCLVLAVHHNTADNRKMIGAQRLFNAADFVIEVVPGESGPGEPKTATLTCRKSKYGPEFTPLTYQVEPLQWTTTGEDGQPAEVRSATVRLQGEASATTSSLRLPGAGPARHRVLPDVSDVPASRKRSGVRTGPRHLAAVPSVTRPGFDARGHLGQFAAQGGK